MLDTVSPFLSVVGSSTHHLSAIFVGRPHLRPKALAIYVVVALKKKVHVASASNGHWQLRFCWIFCSCMETLTDY